MSKKDEEKLLCEGEVVKLLRNANFEVVLDNGVKVQAHTSGRMRKAKVRVLVGDRVVLQMTPYDKTKGIVVHRHKKNAPPPPSA